MINLKKLAMIPLMGMVLSTGALAETSSLNVSVDILPADITAVTPVITDALENIQKDAVVDADGNNKLEIKYIFKAANEDAQNVTFALPTANNGKLTLSHTDGSNDTHTIVIPMALENIAGDDNPSQIAAGDAETSFFVHSSGDSEAAADAEGTYTGHYIVTLVYP